MEKLTANTVKGHSTRNLILLTATHLFYKNGFHKVSFQMIASKVGISQPALYAYFVDKNDILKSSLLLSAEKGRQFIDAQINEKESAKKKLKSYVSANLQWAINDREEATNLLLMYYLGSSDLAIKQIHRQINDIGVGRIENLLIQGSREGSWHIAKPVAIARAIHSLLMGEMIKAYHWPSEVKFEQRLHEVWKNINFLVGTD